MLTTPDNLLFFHLLDDGLQDKLLHHLSRDGGEADRPVVLWVLLLALFGDWSDIGLSPVLGHFSCPPGQRKREVGDEPNSSILLYQTKENSGKEKRDTFQFSCRFTSEIKLLHYLVPTERNSKDLYCLLKFNLC